MKKRRQIYNYVILILLGISLTVPNGFLIVQAEELSNESMIGEVSNNDSSANQSENIKAESISLAESEKTDLEQQLSDVLDEDESTITNVLEETIIKDKSEVEQQLTEAVDEEGITNIETETKEIESQTIETTKETLTTDETIAIQKANKKEEAVEKEIKLEESLASGIDQPLETITNIKEEQKLIDEQMETTTTTIEEEENIASRDFIDESTIGKIALVKGQISQSMAVLIKKVPKELSDMLNETTTTKENNQYPISNIQDNTTTTTTTTTKQNIQNPMSTTTVTSDSKVPSSISNNQEENPDDQPEVGVGAGNIQENSEESTTTTTIKQEENVNTEEPVSLFNIIKKIIFYPYIARAIDEETSTTTSDQYSSSIFNNQEETTTPDDQPEVGVGAGNNQENTEENTNVTTTKQNIQDSMSNSQEEITTTTIPLIEVSGSITINLPEENEADNKLLERELWYVNLEYDIREKIGFDKTSPADDFIVNYDDFIIWKTIDNSTMVVFDVFEHTFQNFEVPVFDIENWENQQFLVEGANFSILLGKDDITILDANGLEIEVEYNKNLKRKLNKEYKLTDFKDETKKMEISDWKLAFAQSRFLEGKILDTQMDDNYFVMRVRTEKGTEVWYGSVANRDVLATKIVEHSQINDNSKIVVQNEMVLWLTEDKKALAGYDLRSKNYFGQSFENGQEENIIEIGNTKWKFRLKELEYNEIEIYKHEETF